MEEIGWWGLGGVGVGWGKFVGRGERMGDSDAAAGNDGIGRVKSIPVLQELGEKGHESVGYRAESAAAVARVDTQS